MINENKVNFRKAHPDMSEKINQWLAFIDDYDKEAVELAEKNNKTLEKARFEMNYLTGDAAVRRLAELREDWEMDRNSDIYYAKEEGKEEGKQKEKFKIAKELKRMGLSKKKIIEATEITEEELEKVWNAD